VIFADRGGGRFELTDDEKRTMLTLGRLAALAASVERATEQRERAKQLSERVSLTREIHEQVIQRLFGLLLVVGSDQPLAPGDRSRIDEELRAVLAELRGALDRSLEPSQPETRTTLRHLLDRLGQRPEVKVSWADGVEIPAELEPILQSVLAEALRNVDKHARATRIEVSVGAEPEAFILEVTNDGAVEHRTDSGLGLRLMSLEAIQHRGIVEFGPVPPDGWRVRLVMPGPRR
jgi:signal transduction histidine kinase